ncbi:MAG TPA: protein-disulfide reductase DsbD [Rhodanobacteraceae bacterium]
MLARALKCFLLAATLLGCCGGAVAQSDGLLKVTDAFALTATSASRGTVTLHWNIADHYYLYRGRIHVTATGHDVKLGKLALPPGHEEHDPYLGTVFIYHHRLTGTQAYTITRPDATSLQLDVTFQGCHEVDPKICYPPHTEHLTLPIPAAMPAAVVPPPTSARAAGAADQTSPLGKSLGSPLGEALGDAPLPPDQAFHFAAIATGPDRLLLRWSMPKGYYLYRDKAHLALIDSHGITLGTPQWPPGVTQHDPYVGDATVYFHEVDVPLSISRAPGSASRLRLKAVFQGCEENVICYPPITREVALTLPSPASAASTGSLAATTPANGTRPPPGADHPSGPASPTATPASTSQGVFGPSAVQKLAGSLGGGDRWLALLGFFAAGLLLAFTPCVLPMIPILSGLIAGAGANVSTRRAFVLSVVYVLASCVVFVIAGVIAGLIGASVQAAFQSPWLLTAFAALFVLLALSMFGFYELKPPAALQKRLTAASNRQHGGSLLGVAVMGVLSALIVGPCVAPPLAGAVLYIAQSHDPAFGALALFLLSLGMGVPLIVFGTAAGRWLPRSGAWMQTVQAVFGVIFLALAIWMLSRFLAPVWIMLMSGVLLIGCAVYLGAFDRMHRGIHGWHRLWKACGLVLLVLGVCELIGGVAGSQNLFQPLAALRGTPAPTTPVPATAFRRIKTVAALQQALAAARAAGKPAMVDFTAAWCVSCQEMRHRTFPQPAVRAAMSHFVLLEADVTANSDADRALLKHYGLFGPPATIFYDAQGRELTGLRLIGFEDASDFVVRLDKARQS